MNILFLDQFSEMGGAQRCLADLLPAIARRGWHSHLAIPGNGPLVEFGRLYRASVHRLNCGPYRSGRKRWADVASFAGQLPSQVSTVARIIRDCAINVLYVNGPRLLPAATLASRGLPLVFHAHSLISQKSAARVARLCLRRRNTSVIANCAFVAEPLRRHREVTVIYNGVSDLARHAPAGGPIRVGIVGRIAPEKGQLEFVRAVRLLAADIAHCSFVMCGAPLFSDPDYAARVRAAASGLPIEFLGWRDDISSVLAGLDLLVVPSSPIEATSRVILEAYSAGVPVVAYRSGGVPEVVEHARTGWLVDPTPEALASRLRDLLANPEQLRPVSRQARAAWQEKYTIERYQNDVVAVLERFDPAPNAQRTPLHSAGASTRA